jgi:hypothetical protein
LAGGSETARRRLERDLACCIAAAERQDLFATLDRHPDGGTQEVRDVLIRQMAQDRTASWPYRSRVINVGRASGVPLSRPFAATFMTFVKVMKARAGEADAIWPSAEMASRIVQCRAGTSAASGDQLLPHAQAGHLSRPPATPTTVDRNAELVCGGTPDGNAVGQRHTALAFLAGALIAPPSSAGLRA